MVPQKLCNRDSTVISSFSGRPSECCKNAFMYKIGYETWNRILKLMFLVRVRSGATFVFNKGFRHKTYVTALSRFFRSCAVFSCIKLPDRKWRSWHWECSASYIPVQFTCAEQTQGICICAKQVCLQYYLGLNDLQRRWAGKPYIRSRQT